MLKEKYNNPIEYIIISILLIAYFLPWISWSMLSISGFDLPFMYKKITNITNKVFFFSKKESLYAAFYFYTVPIFAILSGAFLFITKKRLSRILLFISVANGLIVSLYMFFYLMTSSVLKIKNGGWGLYMLFICSVIGVYYLIAKWKLSYRTKRLEQQSQNELADI